MVTKAKENLMFAVGSMTAEDKEQMSHSIDEFILKCSFNQKDCDIEKYVKGKEKGKNSAYSVISNCITIIHLAIVSRSITTERPMSPHTEQEQTMV